MYYMFVVSFPAINETFVGINEQADGINKINTSDFVFDYWRYITNLANSKKNSEYE